MISIDTQGLRYSDALRSRAIVACWLLVASGAISVVAGLGTAGIEVSRWRYHQGASFGFQEALLCLRGLEKLAEYAAGFFWLLWLFDTFKAARAMHIRGVATRPGYAVVAYCLPLASLVWPAVQMVELHKSLAPEALPDAPVRVSTQATGGYRDQAAAPRDPLPAAAPLALWWGFWVASELVPPAIEYAGLFGSVMGEPSAYAAERAMATAAVGFASGAALRAVAAVLAVSVVRAVTTRFAFYERRTLALQEAARPAQ